MNTTGIVMIAMFFSGLGSVAGFALGVRAGDTRSRSIEAYKLLDASFVDFLHGGTFRVGSTVRGAEIFAGTRAWVVSNYESGMVIVLVRFVERDVLERCGARYRVTRCKVVRAVDPAEVGVQDVFFFGMEGQPETTIAEIARLRQAGFGSQQKALTSSQ